MEAVHYEPDTLREAIQGLQEAGSVLAQEAADMRGYVDHLEKVHQEVRVCSPVNRPVTLEGLPLLWQKAN